MMSCLLEWERPSAGRIHFEALAKAFSAEGHEVVGVIPARPETVTRRVPFVRFYAVPPFTEGMIGQCLRATCHLGILSWAILREQPEALYLRFRSCAPFICVPGRLFGRGTPVIVEYHTWSCAYLQQSGYSALISALSRWSQLFTARSAHRIRTNNSHLKSVLAAHGIDERRIFVAGLGADLDLFRPHPRGESCARLGLDPSFRYVGYVGSLNQWQGMDVIVESLRLLGTSFPRLRAIILGDGPQAAILHHQARRAGLDGMISFKGIVPHEDIPWWITCFDLGIGALRTQPRGRMLGSSMKLVEYAACGVPAITASVEGLEILNQGGAVLLVPPDDPFASAEAITRLLQNQELRIRMGKNARMAAEKSLSWAAIGRDILTNIPRKSGM